MHGPQGKIRVPLAMLPIKKCIARTRLTFGVRAKAAVRDIVDDRVTSNRLPGLFGGYGMQALADNDSQFDFVVKFIWRRFGDRNGVPLPTKVVEGGFMKT